MKLATNEQMHQIDKIAIREFGIPGIILMENAGFAVVSEIVDFLPKEKRVVMICGHGNNGGDGFVIARHLHMLKYNVTVFFVGYPEQLSGDAEVNYIIIKKLKIDMHEIHSEKEMQELFVELTRCDLIVDCLFGTGLNSNVIGIDAKVIEAINDAKSMTLSVDIPSGINGDNGKVMKTAVYAEKTVTFGLPKMGNLMFPGAEHNGELIIKDIGIPDIAAKDVKMNTAVITRHMVSELIPKRQLNSHKGVYGKAKMIAGSMSMAGAAILATKAALRTGLGLARLYVPDSINHIMKTAVPELITIPFQELRKGVIGINHIETILKDAPDSDVFTIGPGCGISFELEEIVKNVLENITCPIILDADALNVLAKNVSVLEKKLGTVIVTPHIGEMSRLAELSVEEVLDNPVRVARNFATTWGVIVVLKSARTVVAAPDGTVYININGNSGMSTAGAGDVLTGIITGLVGQGLNPLDATIAGVYIHGRAGDQVAEQIGEYGLLAGDLVERLPYTIKELASKL